MCLQQMPKMTGHTKALPPISSAHPVPVLPIIWAGDDQPGQSSGIEELELSQLSEEVKGMFDYSSPLKVWDPEASHEFLEPISFHQGGRTIFEE